MTYEQCFNEARTVDVLFSSVKVLQNVQKLLIYLKMTLLVKNS